VAVNTAAAAPCVKPVATVSDSFGCNFISEVAAATDGADCTDTAAVGAVDASIARVVVDSVAMAGTEIEAGTTAVGEIRDGTI